MLLSLVVWISAFLDSTLLQYCLLDTINILVLGTHFFPEYWFCVKWDCDVTMCPSHFVTLAEETIMFTQYWSGFPLRYPPPNLPLSLPVALNFSLYPLLKSSSVLSTSLLYSRLLSGHASDPSVIFLYAFYLNFYIWFCYHLLLIYLGLFMHAVCETDSCIYQWNRVRS